MGITIHFQGKINKASHIGTMMQELANISEEMGWENTVIDDAEQEVKGIIIKPHEKSESLSILVNKNLHLISLIALSFNEANDKSARFVAIKTQFAPIHVHISVIKLLKHLKNKYISKLEVIDEGDYWNTMNEAILKEKMDFLASKIDLLGDILEAHRDEIGELGTPEKLADKLEEILTKLGFKKK